MLKRLELPDGQWADLLVRPRHEDYIAILEAAEEAERGDGTVTAWYATVGRRFCKAWNVRGDESEPLDVSDWSKADPDITDAICIEARNRWDEWQEQRRPLVSRRTRQSATSEPPSEPTSEESRSSSATSDSPTP